MDELISRCEAIKWFFRPYSNEESYSNLDVERALKAIPTVDAAPIVHAKWIASNLYKGYLVCSNCTDVYVAPTWLDGIKWRYCPNCGAKMEN